MEEIIVQWDSVEQMFVELASSDNLEEVERRKVRLWWAQNMETSQDMPRQSHRISFDLTDDTGKKITFPIRLVANTTFDVPNEPR